LEQVAEISDKQEETISYTATFKLENSDKVGFTRRDLASCFFPPQVVNRADRVYDVLMIDTTIIPFDNQRLLHRLLELIPKQYIYNKTVQKITRRSFNWKIIENRLLKKYRLKRFTVSPMTRKGKRNATTYLTELQITSNTSDYDKHVRLIDEIWTAIRLARPQLNMEKKCSETVVKGCPISPRK
jgi:hypothetical protein